MKLLLPTTQTLDRIERLEPCAMKLVVIWKMAGNLNLNFINFFFFLFDYETIYNCTIVHIVLLPFFSIFSFAPSYSHPNFARVNAADVKSE